MLGNRPFLVFDIGGTSMRAATYDVRKGRIDSLAVLDMPSRFNVQGRGAALAEIITMMKGVAAKLMPATDPHSVCVGFPGPVDKEGNVYAAPTIWGLQYPNVLPLRRLIAENWPCANVEVVNDVTAAGYFFVDEITRDFLVVTVGSGIGSKLFINGEAVLGPNARGGEIGHLRVDFSPHALACDCGGIGHLGAIASGRGVLRTAIGLANENPTAFSRSQVHASCGGQPGQLTNETLIRLFRLGDPWAHNVIVACTAFLGRALAAIHLNSGIEAYKVIGGFAVALGDEYRKILADAATSSMWQNGFSWIEAIQVTKADDNPGLNGAGRLLELKYGRFQ
jgi:glucokinase